VLFYITYGIKFVKKKDNLSFTKQTMRCVAFGLGIVYTPLPHNPV
jgi:hypothetical protein